MRAAKRQTATAGGGATGDSSGSVRFGRRLLVGAGAAAAVGAVVGCGEDDDEPALPTETPVPAPTATQGPIASPVASYLDPERWFGRTLTIATLTGPYQEAQDEAYFAPFAAATGAVVQQRSADLADLRNQVENQRVSWDVVCLSMDEVLPLARGGYLEAIRYDVVDATNLVPEVVGQYGVGADLFSTVVTYPVSAPRAPTNWADFWDTAAFPTGRALRKSPVGTMEFALLADGVSMAELYPLDVDRAFRSLDRIRPSVLQWYEDGKQPVELVASGQVGLASAWNVRTELPDVRGTVAVQWTGGMLSANAWIVPLGTANAEVAMDFLNYATRALPQANFARLLPYGPVNADAFPFLREDRLPQLPSAPPHFARQFFENWNFWADNRDALDERLRDWLATEVPADE